MFQTTRVIGLTVFFFALFTVKVNAQTPPPTPSDDQVNAIARELYCPVCENIPLDVCGTQACAQWRGLIRDKLAEGWSKAEIKQYFADQYGDRVLATPPPRGFNWLVYIVPPFTLLAGIYILYHTFFARKKIITPEQSIATKLPDQDLYIARLEEELKNR